MAIPQGEAFVPVEVEEVPDGLHVLPDGMEIPQAEEIVPDEDEEAPEELPLIPDEMKIPQAEKIVPDEDEEAPEDLPVLPDDIVVKLLKHFDPKLVTRCKAVSRAHLELILTDRFEREHLQTMKDNNQREYYFISEFGFSSLFYDAMSVNEEHNGRIISEGDNALDFLASYDGFILCCTIGDEFFIANPSIHRTHTLPVQKIIFPPGAQWGSVCFGVGYDRTVDDYKVVCVYMFNTLEFSTEVMVYSVNSGTWERAPAFAHDFPVGKPGVFVKGHIHWKVCELYNRYSIIGFSVSDYSYTTIAMPEAPVLFRNLELCMLDDDTLGVFSSMVPVGAPYRLWILRDYDDLQSWTLVSISLIPSITNGNHFCSLQPLCFVKPGANNVLFRVDPVSTFYEYDPYTKTFFPRNVAEVRHTFCTIFSYVPSLRSPAPRLNNA